MEIHFESLIKDFGSLPTKAVKTHHLIDPKKDFLAKTTAIARVYEAAVGADLNHHVPKFPNFLEVS